MRLRSLLGFAVICTSLAFTTRARAQDAQPNTAGLVRGDYFRLSGTVVTPVNPGGSLKSWGQGNGVNLMWENWDGAGTTVGLFGFSLYGDVAFLPFKEREFIAMFPNAPTGAVTSATAKRARVIQIGVHTRLRIPMPFIMPSIGVGFGFLDWHPGEITYVAGPSSTATRAKQQNRQGGAFSFTGALDKTIYDRFAIFGEAVYTYGFTSFGQVAGSSSTCVTNDCDLLKNTPLGVLRAGVRYRYK